MSPLDEQLISRKIKFIEEDLKKLEGFAKTAVAQIPKYLQAILNDNNTTRVESATYQK